jgi:hypothetical protein
MEEFGLRTTAFNQNLPSANHKQSTIQQEPPAVKKIKLSMKDICRKRSALMWRESDIADLLETCKRFVKEGQPIRNFLITLSKMMSGNRSSTQIGYFMKESAKKMQLGEEVTEHQRQIVDFYLMMKV